MEYKQTALIIIDMQNDIVLPDGPACVRGALATVPTIVEALTYFRNNRRPVFHVVREYREDGSDVEITRLEKFRQGKKYALPGTPGCEIIKELAPAPGEYRIVKNRFSAFMNTELDFMLRRLDVTQIAVCGTQYPNCVRTTVFDGVCYGYAVTVLTDATSAASDAVAQANIADIKNIGVTCCTVREYIGKQ